MTLRTFLRKNLKTILLIIFFALIAYNILNKSSENFTVDIENGIDIEEKKISFEDLMKDFKSIFPDGNRNAGGPQFFKHIVDMDLSKRDFELYNSFYCGVSGSPVDPERGNVSDYVIVKDINDNDIYGKYYRCCSPCLCDIMKYAKVDKFDITLDGEKHTYDVLTIDDPCCKSSAIPQEVSSFKCDGVKTQNGIHSRSGRLIFALLYDTKPATEVEKENIKDVIGNCRERMNTQPDKLKSGMGDIFVKLSLLCNKDNVEGFEDDTSLKNIYGEPLQKCKTSEDSGSWDEEGYCSERGGGVHQICMEVTPERSDFSSQTGQGPWSEGRVGNNHCMCLGAWALYKAKGKGDDNELQCESIPDYSLSPEYIRKWNQWNGKELNDQIKAGVDSMVEQCYHKKNNKYLKDKYNIIREEYGDWDSIV